MFFLLGTDENRIGRTAWKFWIRSFRHLKSRTATVPASRVPISVDPKESELSYYGPRGLIVQVFITTENHLDVEVRLKKLALVIEMAAERLVCQYFGFLPIQSTELVETIDDVAVPARQMIKGWANFQYKGDIRIADFKQFVIVAQAIGEPEQAYAFEPYDWDDAKKSNSQIIMLPLNDR